MANTSNKRDILCVKSFLNMLKELAAFIALFACRRFEERDLCYSVECNGTPGNDNLDYRHFGSLLLSFKQVRPALFKNQEKS